MTTPIQPQTPGTAIAALILGILGVLVIVPAIPGIICGHLALRTINTDKARFSGSGLAITGLVLSYISLAYGFVVLNMLMQRYS